MPCSIPFNRRSPAWSGLLGLLTGEAGLLALCLFASPGSAAGATRTPLPGPGERAKLPPDGGPEFNRLIHETSPYLAQHARNPVDWHPWGEEALRKAREENKPIFLSVGYSSCHWCHVMEHESFEHAGVAALLNRHFIPVKVDREERPDLDEIYMTATQLMTGRGGWPNSVWLLPDGRPFYAGTYYPRETFARLLTNIAAAWKEQRPALEEQAERLSETMRRSAEGAAADTTTALSPGDLLQSTLEDLKSSFDPVHGGFGQAPKFPPHAALRLLLTRQKVQPDRGERHLATRTLEAMARGGIHDHAGGGFHRYATDAFWLLPHFEKMLYDNAQLLRVYAEAFHLTDRADFRRAAEGIMTWLEREMTGENNGFFSALDADSDGEEGKYYVWTLEELNTVLGADSARIAERFQVSKAGNYYDEATHQPTGRNILHLKALPAEQASADTAQEHDLASVREQLDLLEQFRRDKRVPPGLDDKILTSWNGLMIGALAYAGKVLDNPKALRQAEQASDFLLTTHRSDDGRLLRTSRLGRARLMAYLDDYAFLADGLLDLYEATGDKKRLDQARALAGLLRTHFEDPNGGFFFTAHDHEALLTRGKDPFDRALPSGNAVAARVFYRLYKESKDPEDLATARRTVTAFYPLLFRAPRASATFVDVIGTMLHDQVAPLIDQGPLSVRIEGPAHGAPGEALTLSVILNVQPGWHVNAADPGQDKLIPLSMEWNNLQDLTLGKTSYPRGQELKMAGSDEAALVYTGDVRIPVQVTVPAVVEAGARELKLTLRWQACDEQRCLPPETSEQVYRLQITP